MDTYGKHAVASRPWTILSRRLIRISAAAVFTLFLYVTASQSIQYRQRPRPTELPPNVLWPEPDERNALYNFSTTSEYQPVTIDPAKNTVQELCATFPHHMLSRVQPVLKMGFSEKREKVDAQFESVSACISPKDLLVFSDHEEKLHGHQVIDVLAFLPDTYHNHPNFTTFDQYFIQKQMIDNGTLRAGQDASGKVNGWGLDKFKFLPAVERAWALKPDKEFYVFYETDTYIVWDNMFRFLHTLDPDAELHIGSPTAGRFDDRREQPTFFANGGPGYILSRGAMKKLLHRRVSATGQYLDPPLSERFRYLAVDVECCGDSILSFAAWELGIVLQGYYPLLTPYSLDNVPYNDAHWCHPLITMHKVAPRMMLKLWNWEHQHRKLTTPIMYADVWKMSRAGDETYRENWNNDYEHRTSFRPPPEEKVESFEDCEKLCQADEKCLQWLWKGREVNTCHLVPSIQHGRPQKPQKEDDKWADYRSGWMRDRIEKWRNDRQCLQPEWRGPSLKQIF